ncbi:hypothetical protein ACJX0J_011303, partial [Zea mays]
RALRPREPGAPDTVRCTTGHCPVHHRTHWRDISCSHVPLEVTELCVVKCLCKGSD